LLLCVWVRGLVYGSLLDALLASDLHASASSTILKKHVIPAVPEHRHPASRHTRPDCILPPEAAAVPPNLPAVSAGSASIAAVVECSAAEEPWSGILGSRL
jgi:hypothetical protein